MQLEGLDHVAIAVSDPEASVTWYAQVLGLERKHENVWGDVPAFMMAGASGLAIFPRRQVPPSAGAGERATGFRHLAFRTDREGFERARRELGERGIPTEFQDHEIAHSVYFDDPDGVPLEVTTYDFGARDSASEPTAATQFLRHALATLAYRGGKALRGAPEGFGDLRIAADSRSAGEILAHIGDLLDWALSQAEGRQVWRDSATRDWDDEVERFFAALDKLDQRLAGGEPTGFPEQRMFQGPIADALSHVGQIALLRRLAQSPVRGENYFKAEIEVGRVGAKQADPKREFD